MILVCWVVVYVLLIAIIVINLSSVSSLFYRRRFFVRTSFPWWGTSLRNGIECGFPLKSAKSWHCRERFLSEQWYWFQYSSSSSLNTKLVRSGTAAVGDAHIEEWQLALQHVADDDVKLHCHCSLVTLPEMKWSMHSCVSNFVSPMWQAPGYPY